MSTDTTPRPGLLSRLEARLARAKVAQEAAAFLHTQARSRRDLAKAAATWASLSHADTVELLPVTQVEATNAAGQLVRVHLFATVTTVPGTPPATK